MRVAVAALLLLVAGLPAAAHAWGRDAHRIVCEAARARLSDAARAELDRLVSAARRPDGRPVPSFAEGCILADEGRRLARSGAPGWARFGEIAAWHFANVPRDTPKLGPDLRCDDCVLEAIEIDTRRLADPTRPDAERGLALLLLGHWVADVHQPLHVSFADDRGGNDTLVTGVFGDTNLHYVWDVLLVEAGLGDPDGPRDAERLAARTTSPAAWAAESYALATRPDFLYCRWRERRCEPHPSPQTLTPRYPDRFTPIVSRRLQTAAVRLADRIETALAESLSR